MLKRPKILVAGSFNMDLTASCTRAPRLGETVIGKKFRTAPGGKGFNQAVQCSRLGADVTMVGKVGADDFGKALLDAAKGEGKLTESEKYSADAPKYLNGLVFVQSGTENCDIENTAQWLRRLCKKHDGLSSMLISSNHEAREKIERSVIHTGKRGRPKTIVTGSASVAHVHGAIINENPDTDIEAVKKALTSYCRKRRKKRSNLNQQKIKRAWLHGCHC